MGRVRVGVSGWDYPDWRGTVYPRGLTGVEALAFVADRLPTVEVNRSFYRLTTPEQVRGWYDATPRGFRFAVKGSRFITHVKRLRDPQVPVANFLAAGVLELKEKLGPLLWQLPASQRFDPDRLEPFLALLPHDTVALGELASRHDHRVVDAVVEPDRRRPVQHVLEPRHPSFADPAAKALLRRYRVGMAVSQAAGWPCFEPGVGPVYVRLHGPGELYASEYGPDGLAQWERLVRSWVAAEREAGGRGGHRDAYVYFDNTADGLAMQEAVDFAARW